MFLGPLLVGMALALIAAGIWIGTGGSILSAVAVYSAVGTTFVLGSAVLSHAFAERRLSGTAGLPDKDELADNGNTCAALPERSGTEAAKDHERAA